MNLNELQTVLAKHTLWLSDDADGERANLTDAYLTDANLTDAYLTDANLTHANLTDANLTHANLSDADLTRANLSDADLSGANLSGANLSGAKGLGTKAEEVAFAVNLLAILNNGEGQLNMTKWHSCSTTHCIAGWAFPEIDRPGQLASLKYPTLAKYFYSSNEEALAGIGRVASGEESVFSS